MPKIADLCRRIEEERGPRKFAELINELIRQLDRYGDPDVMSLRDVPVPEPQDGEVLIRVAHAGRSDLR